MTDVLLRDELLRHLGNRRALDRAIATGQWHRPLHGAYARGPGPPALPVRAAAAARLMPDRSAVADRCLLWLLGVDVLPAGPPVLEVVVPRDVVAPRRRDVRCRIADVPAGDVLRLGPAAVRCLRPVRAVADLLRQLPLEDAVVVADAAWHGGLCDARAVRLELAAHAGLKGVVQARRVLDLADPRAESPPETRLRLGLHGAGLVVVPQFVVLDAQGRFVARVDLAMPDLRLAVEHDGQAVHQQPGVFASDRRRQNALVAAGWTVLRFTAADLRHGAAPAVAQVLALVRAAA